MRMGCSWAAWVSILALSTTYHMILSKLFIFLVPQFPICKMGIIILLWRWIYKACSAHYIASASKYVLNKQIKNWSSYLFLHVQLFLVLPVSLILECLPVRGCAHPCLPLSSLMMGILENTVLWVQIHKQTFLYFMPNVCSSFESPLTCSHTTMFFLHSFIHSLNNSSESS